MNYHAPIVRQVAVGGDVLTVSAKPGMVPWREVAAAAELIARHARVEAGWRILLFECGGGALAAWVGRRADSVDAFDQSVISGRMTTETVQANEITNVTVHSAAWPTDESDGAFDLALLPLPKGRAYARVLLVSAWRALHPGGSLYLAGARKAGVRALIKDTGELFGNVRTLAYKAGHRVAEAVKGDRPSDQPDWSDQSVEFEASGLKLFGLPGVFSSGSLDDGTAVLLHGMDRAAAGISGARVLDVGCGCGVIGLHAATLGAAHVDMIDASHLAVACARLGVAANDLPHCRVLVSDLYDQLDKGSYDLILSNPPFHVGRSVDHEAAGELIRGARTRLAPGGRLRLVANTFLPYESLIAQVFGRRNMRQVHRDRRYKVTEATLRR